MRPLFAITAMIFCQVAARSASLDETRVKFADCPPAVRATFHAEAKNAKIESVVKEPGDGGELVYWADAVVGEKNYAIGVLEDGTLSEMNLAATDTELTLDRCPSAVQEAFGKEAFGEKIAEVRTDRKYGVNVYEVVIEHKEKMYEIVVAEDGTLVEKVLVIDDEEIELTKCPQAVQAAFHHHAKGGKIRDVTRSSGIGKPTYEAEVGVKNSVYLVEIDENGVLLSKSLEASVE